MQRLRTTFKRSRTPTGAEMKTQSSLEVPKQVRSASFDEIKLEAKRLQATSMSPRPEDPGGADRGRSLLSVPSTSQQRSKSFDSGGAHQSESGAFLEIPMRRFQRRKSSGDKAPPYCIHCILTENSSRMRVEEPSGSRSPAFSDTSTSDEEAEDWYSDDDSVLDPYNISIEVAETPDDTMISPQCSITVTQPPNSPSTSAMDNQPPECYSPSGRRRSITSAKLERQEAFIFNETPADPSIDPPELQESNLIVSQFFLAVPELKRDRAASVDSCFLNKSSSGKAEEVVPQSSGVLLELPTSGSATLRSRSVDIVLPTDQQAHYKALAMNSNNSAPVPKSGEGASGGSPTRSGSGGLTRVTPDWGENAVEAEHLWILINPSTDFCHCGESECVISKTSKTGTRYKCSSCKIICHASCISILERQKVQCKPTFRDVGIRSYREQTTTKHHWVHRRQQKGKCKACGKSFHSKLSFSTKEIVAINCSWCKDPYHNKETCFNSERIDEDCSLGTHHPIIVPPSWIVKLPRRGSFKSSLRKSPKKKTTTKKTPSKERSESDTSDPSVEKEERTFTLKPIPTSNVRPVIVFINPKSGGNQGIKLLQKFQWLLNPRQVFDLTQGGPRFGLELFRKVSNLRVLACGGDGTVGWVLSVIDQLTFNPPPAVGVLPLGTGNDLARALGWGGGYTDEPITKILYNIGESDVIRLDRWKLDVEKNENGETSETAKDNLPLNVVNNYFSMGVDAHIALEFHEAREAHPERFNSRLKNKMFYGQMGGKDLVKRKWKDLADYVTLVCDDKDFTPKLLECKFHAIVFLNIPSYGGGTNPWSKVPGIDTSTDDGLIEVVGLSTFQLPLLQAGAHGTSICQCKTATITTTKPIPMQVDGEACRLNPSVITLSLLNKAPMLTKRKRGRNINPNTTIGSLKMSVNLLNMPDYEQYHNDKTRLKQSAVNIGVVDISPVADLENTRQAITDYVEAARKAGRDVPELPPDWCFVDSCTAERFFRIDRAQEHLHFLTDIANDAVYILDQTVATPEDDSAFADLASAEPSPPSQVEDTPELSPCDEAPQQIDPENNRLGGPSGSVQVDRQEQQSSNDIPPDETGYISNLLEKTTDGVVKAAKSGDIKKLKELHGHGYSLLSIDSTGQTALHYSAQNGFKDVVKYMIASAPHSILNMADNENGSVDGVVWPRRSCESNSNVLEELPCSMDTYFAFFETPISEECPTNNELEPSMTPALTLAILLLPSPLMFLFNFHTSLEVVMGFWKALMLVSLGQTALHKAARNRHRSVCCMLVAGGASLSLIDNFGNTPRLLALEAKDHQLAAYLESQEQFQLLAEDLEGS